MELITNKKDIKRIKTYIQGLDENMEGGIPEGHIVLISGKSGTMKSSVCFNLLYNEALKGKTSLYLNLEQSTASLLKNMVNMDFDLSKVNIVPISDFINVDKDLKAEDSKKGNIILADLGAIRKKVRDVKFFSSEGWLNAVKNVIDKIAKKNSCELFVFDSLNALYSLADFEGPRPKLFFVFEFLRNLNLTSLIIHEPKVEDSNNIGFGIEEYLSDGIIKLELTQRYRKVTRELSISKMRATNCNLDIFTLEYVNKKFVVKYGGKTPVL